jgi:hypothetical protein
MKNLMSFVKRQSGFLSFFVFLFALERSKWVFLGLWHGGGLQGYVNSGSGPVGDTPSVVPVWIAFIEAIVLMTIAVLLLLIALHQKRSRTTVSTPVVPVQDR